MSEMTPDEIQRLQAEVKALRARAGVIHPLDVEPAYFVGQWVEYDGLRRQVLGRSIDEDRNVTYHLGVRDGDGWETHAEDAAENTLAPVAHRFPLGSVVIDAQSKTYLVVDHFHDEDGAPVYHVQEANITGGQVSTLVTRMAEPALGPAVATPAGG